jgi:hypothetical protein
MVDFHHVEGDREGSEERRALLRRWLTAGEPVTAAAILAKLVAPSWRRALGFETPLG